VAIYRIVAIGQLMVILTGGIDLSVGPILGLAAQAQMKVSSKRRNSGKAGTSSTERYWFRASRGGIPSLMTEVRGGSSLRDGA
jgi:ribose/xylose/arabinose/galactoside ABC-type transport system permease subunit